MTRLRRLAILFLLGLFTASTFADALVMSTMSLSAGADSINIMEDGKDMGECEDCITQTESCGYCGAGCISHIAVGMSATPRVSQQDSLDFMGTSITFQSITGPPDPFPPREIRLT